MDLLYFINIFVFFEVVFSFFDFEELKRTNYGLEIFDQPVVIPTELSATELLVTSVHGQHYQCHYPEVSNKENNDKEEKQAMEIGITEMLKPMENKPCLLFIKGWWTYEFCFGKEIKQYHQHDGKISGEITTLGLFDIDFNWEDESMLDERKRMMFNRYHSQSYVNGSICDLTNKPRRTEVRFFCEDGKLDYIYRVDEPFTCNYLINVHTALICHHPYLKPPLSKLLVPILCNPVLTPEDLRDYIQELELQEDEKQSNKKLLKDQQNNYLNILKAKNDREDFILKDGRLIEVIKEAKTEYDAAVVSGLKEFSEGWTEIDTDELVEGNHEGETKLNKAFKDLDKAFSDALTKTMRDTLGDEHVKNGQMKFKVFKDIDEVKDAIHKYKTEKPMASSNKILGEYNYYEEDEGTSQEGLEAAGSEGVEESFDNSYLNEDNLNVEDASFTAEDRKTMKGQEKQSQQIIKEKEWTMNKEGNPSEDKHSTSDDIENEEMVKEFEKELESIIMDKMGKAKMSQHIDTIKNTMNEKFTDIIEEAEKETELEGVVSHDELKKQMAESINELMSSLRKAERDLKSAERNRLDAEKSAYSAQQSAQSVRDSTEKAKKYVATFKHNDAKDGDTDFKKIFDEKVLQRDTGIKTDSNLQWQSKSDEKSQVHKGKKGSYTLKGNKLQDSESKKEINVGDRSKSKFLMESAEKKGDATFKSEKPGTKIDVKIVKAGYYNDDDGAIKYFTDEEDVAELGNVLMAMLGESPEQQREEKRHYNLEKGYRFNFVKQKKSMQEKEEKLKENIKL